jgi:hypothetical protein
MKLCLTRRKLPHKKTTERDAEIVTEAEAALRENYGEQCIALPQDRGSRQVGGAGIGTSWPSRRRCVVVAGGAALCATRPEVTLGMSPAPVATWWQPRETVQEVPTRNITWWTRPPQGFVKGADWCQLQPKGVDPSDNVIASRMNEYSYAGGFDDT